MILVTLGTQDKSFERLLIEIEKLKSNITEKLKKSPRIQHSWGYCFL